MNLWILRPVDAAAAMRDYATVSVKRWTWDCSYGFVVRAVNEQSAREMASAECGDEGSDCWLDSRLTTCDLLDNGGDSEVVMKDFLAG